MADRKPFLLRIDPKLWTELEAWAANELRSVNGQIEYLLKQAVLKRKGVANLADQDKSDH
ncbi:MAG: Arc family DNA binding domain-containing protein [Verrucomicrobia bacterium]|nr:Arc family DNA binding domain-containing protein [Verrucomicrobiota bacterium]